MFTATGDWATILPVSAVRTHAATGALQVNKISNPTVTRELSMIRRTTTAAWLARRHAITVLPAVSSLKALRRVGRPSAATKPMIGFGNPLLDGDPAERPWGSPVGKTRTRKAGLSADPVAAHRRLG